MLVGITNVPTQLTFRPSDNGVVYIDAKFPTPGGAAVYADIAAIPNVTGAYNIR